MAKHLYDRSASIQEARPSLAVASRLLLQHNLVLHFATSVWPNMVAAHLVVSWHVKSSLLLVDRAKYDNTTVKQVHLEGSDTGDQHPQPATQSTATVNGHTQSPCKCEWNYMPLQWCMFWWAQRATVHDMLVKSISAVTGAISQSLYLHRCESVMTGCMHCKRHETT